MIKKSNKTTEQEVKHKTKSEKVADKDIAGNEVSAGEEMPAGTEKPTEKQPDNTTKDQEAATTGLNADIEKLIEEQKNARDKAEEAVREWQDKYIRLSAEFDNYRKRTLKEKTDLIKQANSDLLKDILPVIDDLERGIDHIDKTEDLEGLKKGILLIYNKFVEFVRQNGIKEIEAKEKDFDIDFHEALTKIPAPSEELKGKVVDVIEKGYLLNDRVIRYAKVVVGE
ncbi:MAG: nucleotide exchange factor GrpE [Bacteroidales bacterium]|nr:nucleotide exchange factor GrpE [Bacteroidales bacterium]